VNAKTQTTDQDKATPAAPVVAKQPETPEKASGPQHAVPTTTSAPPPPSDSRGGEMLAQPGAGAVPRALSMLNLQRKVGNNRISNMLGGVVQTKLSVGPADDPHEREADTVADTITQPENKTNSSVQRHLLMRQPLAQSIQRVPAKVIQRSLKDLDDRLDRFDVPEEEVITLIAGLNDAEKKTVLAGGYKGQLADALDIGEMVRAVAALNPPLSVKLDWVKAAAGSASDIDYSNIKGMVTKAPQPERDVLKSGPWREFFVDVCTNETMIEALTDLQFDLATKLEWADEEIDLDYSDIQGFVTTASDPERAALKNDAWRDFFVGVCDNDTIITALNDLKFDLATKLEWAAEEISLDYSDIKGFITSAPQPERDALKNGAWRAFFTDVCDNDDIVEAVNDLNFDLGTKLDWMIDEGTSLDRIASVIRITPTAELAPVAADVALMAKLREELDDEDDYKYVTEMLTHGLLFKGEVELEEPETGNEYENWLRHTRGEVTISKDVHFVEEGTFAPGKFSALKLRVVAAVTTHLSGKFKVRIASPTPPPKVGDGDYPIVVVIRDNPSADYEVNLHGGKEGRSAVSERGGDFYELGQTGEGGIPDATLAHESAHILLGASDEYADASAPARTVYTDHSIMGDYYTEGIAAAGIKARNFQNLVEHISDYFPDRNISIVP
jgi:hypothetical protein